MYGWWACCDETLTSPTLVNRVAVIDLTVGDAALEGDMTGCETGPLTVEFIVAPFSSNQSDQDSGVLIGGNPSQVVAGLEAAAMDSSMRIGGAAVLNTLLVEGRGGGG